MTRGGLRYAILGFLVAGAVACAPTSRNGSDGDSDLGDGDGDGPGDLDASLPFDDVDGAVPMIPDASTYADSGSGGGDGGCAGTGCSMPVPDGCGPTELCDNGSDDDCDTQVDEGCPCTPGAVQACFQNVPGKRGVGACTDGQQTCQGSGEFTNWGPCVGGIKPTPEACDSVDNDCNGCVDDEDSCCEVDLMCPTSMPEGAPFQDYVIDGTSFYGGPVINWTWTVTGGPCDELLDPNVTFTLNGMTTSTISGANASTLTLKPSLSGDYIVNVKITLADGTVYECTFIVHIAGPGLRVELCWDTIPQTDIDLHVHRPGNSSPWFSTDGTPAGPENNDDCFFGNCKATGYSVNWGYANSPLSECAGGPEGLVWQFVHGHCKNPRLDIDNVGLSYRPENMNIDRPENAKSYRVAVHYYDGALASHPMVNVYCGGTLKGTYGKAPDVIPGFGSGGPGHAEGPIWRVVDVTPAVDGAGVTTDCTLAPITAPGGVGPHVTCPKPGSAADCANLSFN